MPSVRDRMTPLFFGGSLTSPAFLPRPKRPGRFKVANHSIMRQIDECSCGGHKPNTMLHHPL